MANEIEYKYNEMELKNIVKFLSKNHTIKIGVLGKSKKGTYEGIGAVELATVHEFGSFDERIPRRSFLEKTKEKKMLTYHLWLLNKKKTIYKKIADGNGEAFLNLIGTKWVAWVKETFIDEGPGWPALKKRTIAARRRKSTKAPGNETPEKFPILRDTSALMRSITHEVISD